MTKLELVTTAVPVSTGLAAVNAGVINVALDAKEVSVAYVQVFGKNYRAEYTTRRNARKPFVLDLSKF